VVLFQRSASLTMLSLSPEHYRNSSSSSSSSSSWATVAELWMWPTTPHAHSALHETTPALVDSSEWDMLTCSDIVNTLHCLDSTEPQWLSCECDRPRPTPTLHSSEWDMLNCSDIVTTLHCRDSTATPCVWLTCVLERRPLEWNHYTVWTVQLRRVCDLRVC